MSRRSDTLPTWRALGAALTAFCLGVQLLVSGLSMGGMVRAAADSGLAADLAVICTHDGPADQTSGGPDPQKPHELCPVCTCAQFHPLTPPLPQAPLFAILRGRSERLPVRQAAADADHHVHAPYASRAPPLFA
jgi:DUF2946 family protein